MHYAAGLRDYIYDKAGSHLVFSLLKIHEYIVASGFQLFKAVNKNAHTSRAKKYFGFTAIPNYKKDYNKNDQIVNMT